MCYFVILIFYYWNEYVGVSFVVRNDRGEFIRARASLVRGRPITREAKVLSLKEALSWWKSGERQVHIWVRCQTSGGCDS